MSAAQIHGRVEYRIGDGPLMCVPTGHVEFERGRSDVTLSWGNDTTRQSAAIPAADFDRYVSRRAIVLAQV